MTKVPGADATDHEVADCLRAEYAANVATGLDGWADCSAVEDQWVKLKCAVTEAADATLGRQGRRQPDWFAANAGHLDTLLTRRNKLYSKWLQSKTHVDLCAFKMARGHARAAVRAAKRKWLQSQADLAQHGRFSGQKVWSAISAMKKCYDGLQPVPCRSMRKSDGSVCSSLDEERDCWQHHFQCLLNVPSSFNPAIFDSITQRDIDRSLWQPSPTSAELVVALRHMANGKAAGGSGIVAELLKAAFGTICPYLIDLLNSIWTSGTVPAEWRNAVLVPIPKKGDLSRFDNWRGISLLDVVGKLVGRVLQSRLQRLAEKVLPESQCGFRRGRSCTDGTFCIRQLVEKFYEHRQKGYLVFVDLRKAYDSVPRPALAACLLKLGVPEELTELILQFHCGMEAEVRVGAEVSGSFPVENGLRQGCTMAPVLFNLFFGVVMMCWRDAMRQASTDSGISLSYNINGQLYSRAKGTLQVQLHDFEFADDAVLLSMSRAEAEQSLQTFHRVASSFGLSVSSSKTQFMVVGVGISPEDRMPMDMGGDSISYVESFVYLGSLITPDTRSSPDIQRRIANAAKAFGCLLPVFRDTSLTVATKRHLYTACVLSVLLYGAESWAPLRHDLDLLDNFHHRCIRSILCVSRRQQWEEKISSATLRARWGDTTPVSDLVRRRRLEWLGHVARMPADRAPVQILFGRLSGRRPPCGPRRRWKDVVQRDMKAAGVDSWFQNAQDRQNWRMFLAEPPPHTDDSPPLRCLLCARDFRRRNDMARHKCIAQRKLPVSQQKGARQCMKCMRWLRSAGGLAVHRCPVSTDVPTVSIRHESDSFRCDVCRRSFRSRSGLSRHHCDRAKRMSRAARNNCRHECEHCERRFSRPQDLQRHAKYC